jgi:hypothetical protein
VKLTTYLQSVSKLIMSGAIHPFLQIYLLAAVLCMTWYFVKYTENFTFSDTYTITVQTSNVEV